MEKCWKFMEYHGIWWNIHGIWWNPDDIWRWNGIRHGLSWNPSIYQYLPFGGEHPFTNRYQQFLNFHQVRILSTDSRPVTCIAVVIPRHSQPVTWNSKFDIGNNTLTNFNSWFHNGNHNGNHELFHHDFHLISWRDFWESFGSLIFRWGDIQSAVRLVFPGELSRHAVSEGCKVPLGNGAKVLYGRFL